MSYLNWRAYGISVQISADRIHICTSFIYDICAAYKTELSRHMAMADQIEYSICPFRLIGGEKRKPDIHRSDGEYLCRKLHTLYIFALDIFLEIDELRNEQNERL